MKKERIKQIVLIILGFAFISIGFLNFNYLDDSVEVSSLDARNEINLGDVQLVNSETTNALPENSKEYLSELVSNEDLENMINVQNIIEKAENEIKNIPEEVYKENLNDYFAETRLEREKMYSQTLEIYQNMLENPEVNETQKAIAVQEISNINNIKNGIMISENLIKNKGFEDVIVLVNNENVSVVVKSLMLNQEEIAKIQNIISRELNVELSKINISKK